MRVLFHITGFTFFPFLLLRGPVCLSRQVLQWLQNMFDCHVSLLQLSQDDLATLVGQYATAEKGSVRCNLCGPNPVLCIILSSDCAECLVMIDV